MPSKVEVRLIRLEFETPVRFGTGKGSAGLDRSQMTASSDTVFSAICLEWIGLYGQNALSELIECVQKSDLKISSLMPWRQVSTAGSPVYYYLPRPLLSGQHTAGVGSSGNQLKKQLKKIPWIEASQMQEYLVLTQTGEGSLDQWRAGFGSEVVWDRVRRRDVIDPTPYQVSAWQFLHERSVVSNQKVSQTESWIAGLYLMVCTSDSTMSDKIVRVIESIGNSGLGGKISSGLGKYILWEDQFSETESGRKLAAMLTNLEAPIQMIVSAVSPNDSDRTILSHSDSRYLLIERKGFAASPMYCDKKTGNPLKRKSCVMLREGSCFPNPLEGRLLDLSYDGFHPIYRLGTAFNVGLGS